MSTILIIVFILAFNKIIHVPNKTISTILQRQIPLSAYSNKTTYLTFYSEKFQPKHSSTAKGLAKRFPTTLIAGFSKCGTHALRAYLTLHPSIVAETPEMEFFNFNFDKGFEWYRNLQPESYPDQITIEKTPNYIESKECLQRIHNFNPRMKIIVLVRDPVVRVQSHYARLVFQIDNFNRSFTEWLKENHQRTILRMGNYAPYVRDLYNLFDKDQVLILDGELFAKDPIQILQVCERFLGIEPVFTDNILIFDKKKGYYCINTKISLFKKLKESADKNKIDVETGCFKGSKGRDHPAIPRDIQNQLINFFRPTTEDLFHVIDQKFQWTGFEGDDNDEM